MAECEQTNACKGNRWSGAVGISIILFANELNVIYAFDVYHFWYLFLLSHGQAIVGMVQTSLAVLKIGNVLQRRFNNVPNRLFREKGLMGRHQDVGVTNSIALVSRITCVLVHKTTNNINSIHSTYKESKSLSSTWRALQS